MAQYDNESIKQSHITHAIFMTGNMHRWCFIHE